MGIQSFLFFIVQADFLFVALGPGRKTLPVNGLQLESAAEKADFADAERRKETRKERSLRSLDITVPTGEEAGYMHGYMAMV